MKSSLTPWDKVAMVTKGVVADALVVERNLNSVTEAMPTESVVVEAPVPGLDDELLGGRPQNPRKHDVGGEVFQQERTQLRIRWCSRWKILLPLVRNEIVHFALSGEDQPALLNCSLPSNANTVAGR